VEPAERVGVRNLILDLNLRNPLLPAGAIAVAIWLVWAAESGGYAPTQWGLVGTLLVLLVGIAAVANPPRAGEWGRARTIMLALLAAFVAWNYLSILWADVPSDAWAGADKMLVYAAGVALFAMWPWSAQGVVAVLGLFTLGAAVVGVVTLVHVANAADATGFFEEGRLRYPIGYVNGNVAFWMSAAWPALYLAASPTLGPVIRATALAAAGLFVDLAVLGQSRAWLFLMPLAVALALLLARQRLRLVLAGGLVTVATLAIARPLLDVHDQFNAAEITDPTLGSQPFLVLGACLGLGFAGAVWAVLDPRVEIGRRAQLALTAVVLTCAVVGLAGAGAVAASRIDHPSTWIRDRWDDFAGGAARDDSQGSRFTGSLSSGRYGEWKVAWAEFLDHPVVGIGADNYATAYLERRTDNFREPRYPHSIELRLLSQLGIVGTALFVGFLGIALWLALRRRRHLDAVGGGAIGACLMIFGYWLLYGSQDWFWEIPVLAGPAFGFLGLATAPPGEELDPASSGSDAAGSRWLRIVTGVAVAAIALGGAAALVLPGASAAYTDAALGGWRADPGTAYARLDRAAALNPLSAEPYLLKGSMALQVGNDAVAKDAFREALAREPKSWYAYLQLAMLAGSRGDAATARRYLDRSLALNPNDKVSDKVRRLLDEGKPIDPNELNQRFLSQYASRFPGSLRPPTGELR